MRPDKYFVKFITYPLLMAKDGRSNLYRYLWEYRKYNSLAPGEIRKRQMRKLESLLKHAWEHTRYYRAMCQEASITFGALSDPVSALESLPVLTKERIMKNAHDMLADNISKDRLTQDSTGGSTGIPLVFYRDKECFLKRKAQELFFDKWIGYEIGSKVAFFVAARHHPKGSANIKYLVRNALGERILAFDPYRIDSRYMEVFLSQLRKFKPEIIKCFPNSLFIFANFLKEKGVDEIRPRAISCTGETLQGYQRELFREVFQCPVFEKYGSFEVGVAACECSEHNGMHMFLDGVFFEFLDSDGKPAKPGDIAKLIVTDLFNYGFPLIRYQIGDVGAYSAEPCRCGSPLPVMKKLYGRDRDILVDEKGDPKPGYLFVEVFNKNHIPGQFQVLQEQRNKVLVRAVKHAGFDRFHENLILEKFRDLLGSSIRIEITYVKSIPREKSGKYKYVHSMVSPFK